MSHYLTLLGVGKPVAYFPKLGVMLGSVKVGIFLCQMIFWHDKASSDLGVYKTSSEIQDETGLTYREQVGARKILSSLGLITETNKRLEHKIYFKFNSDVFDEWLSGCLGLEVGEQQKCISPNDENAFREQPKAHFVLQENTTKNTTESINVHFEEFWRAYPKKQDKKKAEQRFLKINFKKNPFEKIMASLDELKKTDDWIKENGKYVPMASTWINGERWNDVEPPIIEKQNELKQEPPIKIVKTKRSYI